MTDLNVIKGVFIGCGVIFLIVAGMRIEARMNKAAIVAQNVRSAEELVVTSALQVYDRINPPPRPYYLVIGDSITAAARLPIVDGIPGINAGSGGLSARLAKDYAAQLVMRLKPDLTVIALGMNDRWEQDIHTVRVTFEQLIESIDGPKAILGVTNSTVEAPLSTASVNDMLRDVSMKRRITFIESDQAIPTIDGVHIAAEHYERWINGLAKAVRAARAETGRP